MSLSSWRATLRIARRDALRAKGRSALIIAMIALPIVGVTGADIVARSSHLSAQETSTRLMGTADAYVSTSFQPGWRLEQAPNPSAGSTRILSQSGPKPVPTAEETARAAEPLDQLVKEALPAGARLLPVEAPTGYALTSTKYGQGSTQTWGMDLSDPLTSGIVTLRQGSWPSAPYDVAATPGFLAASGLQVGQSTTLVGTTQPLKITSSVEYPGDLGVSRLVGPARRAERTPRLGGGRAHQRAGARVARLPGHPAGAHRVQLGAGAEPPTPTASRWPRAPCSTDPPADGAVPLYADSPFSRSSAAGTALRSATIAATAAGMALLEIVLLAGPAFAVGARRSRRQLGLIAAAGGNREHIRAVVLAGGVVLGVRRCAGRRGAGGADVALAGPGAGAAGRQARSGT